MQAFVKTAGAIYKKIQDGVFDVSNEVVFFISNHYFCSAWDIVSPIDVTLSIIYAYTHVPSVPFLLYLD